MNQAEEPLSLDVVDQQIVDVESQIYELTSKLEEARETVQRWVDENSSLSQSAAAERAKTQSMGRGDWGMVLGAKFRASRRQQAAQLNAQIANTVAARRAKIKQGKQNAQELVRQIQAEITQLKSDLKLLKSQRKAIGSTKKPSQSVQASSRSLLLLEKLNEAYQMGLLTEEEFEEKRRKIVDQI